MGHLDGRPRRASLFVTCLGDLFFPEVGTATVRLLRRAGLEVDFPERQTCCGQPALNSGFRQVTRQAAIHWMEVFRDAECIVSPFGSCVSLVKNDYPLLFEDNHALYSEARSLASRTFELSSFLVNILGVEDFGAAFPNRVTYHDGCHVLRGLGIRAEPRRLLSRVKGLELVEMEPPPECCGFGGTFAVRMPHVSAALLDDKITRIAATGAPFVVSTELGCMLNIAGGLSRRRLPIRMIHLANLLAGEANG